MHWHSPSLTSSCTQPHSWCLRYDPISWRSITGHWLLEHACAVCPLTAQIDSSGIRVTIILQLEIIARTTQRAAHKHNNARVDSRLRPQSGAALWWVSLSIRRDAKSCCLLLSHIKYTLFRVAHSWPLSANVNRSYSTFIQYLTCCNAARRKPSHGDS